VKTKFVASLVATVVVVASALTYLGLGNSPQLGLDLRGGISAILTPVLQDGEEIDSDVLDQTIEVIRARIDSLGVAEPEIARQGTDVLVQLPGLQDEQRAREIIGRTAKLTFRPVEGVIGPNDPSYDEVGPDCADATRAPGEELPDGEGGVLCDGSDDPNELVVVFGDDGQPLVGDDGDVVRLPVKYQVGPAALSGAGIDTALPIPGSGVTQSGEQGWSVQLDLTGDGGDAFAGITADLACARDQGQPGLLAIVLDDVVESAPAMNPDVACGIGITGGTAVISINGNVEEASDLSLVLKTGALPITLEPSTFETVSPTLGEASLDAGLTAGLIGLALVVVYLIFFYRWLGLIAIGALLIFGVLMLGIMTLLGEIGFTLTLAGIAGVIVSIGITADSSIIYFERLRDEIETGRTVRTSTQRAFTNAFRTNLTGNTTTLAAAIVLYFLAVGPVRGFALTLGIATVLDIIIMYVYTRAAVGLLGRTRLLTPRSVRASVPVPAAGGSQ